MTRVFGCDGHCFDLPLRDFAFAANVLASRSRRAQSRAMKKQTVHLTGDSGNVGTYCGWLMNDERRPNLRTTTRRPGPLPALPASQAYCRSCLRVEAADARFSQQVPPTSRDVGDDSVSDRRES